MLMYICDYGGEKYTKDVKSSLTNLTYMDDKGQKHEIQSEDAPCHVCEDVAEDAKKKALESRRQK